MITFGRKLNHLRQKNHLTQKELGIALGFPEDSTDIRITQYEATTRKPLDEILVKLDKILGVLRALKKSDSKKELGFFIISIIIEI